MEIEDIICEPTRKCEMCGWVGTKEEFHKVKIDENGDYLDVCDSCYEGSIA